MKERFLAVSILILVFSLNAIAQVTTGTILGTVKDPSELLYPACR